MSDDLLITPGSRKLEIKDSSGNVDAKIETDASGNLLITNAGGDIAIGDTTSDIFIGDGTNNVDIVFEQDGEIRGTSGVTVTLGASGSNVRMATDLNLNGNDITGVGDLTVTGNLTITGDINSYNVTDLDVSDKTITLGVGQSEINSGDSGIIISGSNASMLWNESNDRFDFNKSIRASVFLQSGTSGSSFYAASFTRSSSTLTTPDIWGSSGTLVLGTSSSDERLALSTNGALIYGRALVRQASADQNTSQDSASIPDTTGAEIMRFEGSYTNGTYTTEFAKVDRSGNLPLYVRQSKGTANSFSNIARFGDHGQTNGSDMFAVFGGARVTGTISTGSHGTSANWNTAYGWGDHASAGYTTNTGTVTSIATGTGLDGTFTTSGTISLDLSELTDKTDAIDASVDEIIMLDNGSERRKRFSEIFGSNAYNSTTIPTNNNQLTNGAGYITGLAFNNLTSKTSGTGDYSTSGSLRAGRGSGGVALTHNDGYGNANVTFNHVSGVPEQGTNCGRIVVNTDGTTNATMYFE